MSDLCWETSIFVLMETLIVHPDNEDKLAALKAVMKVLHIKFEIESREHKEDRALHVAMEEGRKTSLLSDKATSAFLSSLRSAK